MWVSCPEVVRDRVSWNVVAFAANACLSFARGTHQTPECTPAIALSSCPACSMCSDADHQILESLRNDVRNLREAHRQELAELHEKHAQQLAAQAAAHQQEVNALHASWRQELASQANEFEQDKERCQEVYGQLLVKVQRSALCSPEPCRCDVLASDRCPPRLSQRAGLCFRNETPSFAYALWPRWLGWLWIPSALVSDPMHSGTV